MTVADIRIAIGSLAIFRIRKFVNLLSKRIRIMMEKSARKKQKKSILALTPIDLL